MTLPIFEDLLSDCVVVCQQWGHKMAYVANCDDSAIQFRKEEEMSFMSIGLYELVNMQTDWMNGSPWVIDRMIRMPLLCLSKAPKQCKEVLINWSAPWQSSWGFRIRGRFSEENTTKSIIDNQITFSRPVGEVKIESRNNSMRGTD